jgi:hypothetical protein
LPMHYGVDPQGYPRVAHHDGDNRHHFRVHRLLAIAEHGIEAIRDDVVHHRNNVKWDNRPSNITVMSNGDHVAHHNRKRDGRQGPGPGGSI